MEIFDFFKNLKSFREYSEALNKEMQNKTFEGSSGGGMVTAIVTGGMQLVKITISDAIWQLNDKQMLEDLIVGAVNDAFQKVQSNILENISSNLFNFLGNNIKND